MEYVAREDYPPMNGIHRWVEFTEKNKKGESLKVEVVVQEWGDKNTLWDAWIKHGWMKKKLPTLLFISTYATDEDGNQRGLYNPQHKRSEDGRREVVDFDWMLEGTEENIERILEETYRRFMEAN